MRNAPGQEAAKRTGLLDFQGHLWHNKQLQPDMEKQTGSKLGKEYVKAVYCHPACLTHMQNMLDWMKHKLESRLLGEVSTTSDMQMTPPLWQKAKRN